jgi:hypothetical protein
MREFKVDRSRPFHESLNDGQESRPLVLAAGLGAVVLVVLVTFIVLLRALGGGGSSGNAAAAPSETPVDQELDCGGGEKFETSVDSNGTDFEIVGRLASIEDDHTIMVRSTDNRYVQMKVEGDGTSAKVTAGDIVRIKGHLAEGDSLTATQIDSLCPATPTPTPVKSVPAGQSSAPRSGSSSQTNAPEATSAPTDAPQPTRGDDGSTPKPTHKPDATDEPTETAEPTPELTDPPTRKPTETAAATAAPEATAAEQ